VRSAFLDLARAVAILMMIQGHTLDAVLVVDARAGTAFDVWWFLRGLTACMFLLLSGFSFTLATARNWSAHVHSRTVILRRWRRFGFFLFLGYALHFPMAKLGHLPGMSDERWRSFLAVDVLQCTAVMLVVLQALVWLTGTRARHAGVVAITGGAIVALTPVVWSTDWASRLPLLAASYLSPATGSQFPLLPWGGYVMLGAALGHLHAHRGIDRVVGQRILLRFGLALLALALIGSIVTVSPFGQADFWTTSPTLFLLRSGLVLVLLSAVARVSQGVSPPPYAVHALARESLTIYAVHLCLVYGSVWNAGLRQVVGASLTILPALGVVALMWISMTALACAWRWCKQRRPRTARWVRVGTAALLLGRLL